MNILRQNLILLDLIHGIIISVLLMEIVND